MTVEKHPTEYLTYKILLKPVKVIKTEVSLRNCHNQMEPKMNDD